MNRCMCTDDLRMTWLDRYCRDGFIIFPKALPKALVLEAGDELDLLLRTSRVVCSADNMRCRYKPHLSTGVPRLEAIDPVIDLLACCDALDPRRATSKLTHWA